MVLFWPKCLETCAGALAPLLSGSYPGLAREQFVVVLNKTESTTEQGFLQFQCPAKEGGGTGLSAEGDYRAGTDLSVAGWGTGEEEVQGEGKHPNVCLWGEERTEENRSGFSPPPVSSAWAALPLLLGQLIFLLHPWTPMLQFLVFEQLNPQVEMHFHLPPFNVLCVLLCFVF